MKNALLVSLVCAFGLAPIADAAASDRHDQRGERSRYEQRDDRREYRSDHRYDHRVDHRRDHRYGDRDQRSWSSGSYTQHWQAAPSHYTRHRAPYYQPPRGYQARHWQRGHYLPSHYRASPYVVDYRHYRLAAPPRGYHYVRVNDDVVLAAIASGLISDVLFNLFYR